MTPRIATPMITAIAALAPAVMPFDGNPFLARRCALVGRPSPRAAARSLLSVSSLNEGVLLGWLRALGGVRPFVWCLDGHRPSDLPDGSAGERRHDAPERHHR